MFDLFRRSRRLDSWVNVSNPAILSIFLKLSCSALFLLPDDSKRETQLQHGAGFWRLIRLDPLAYEYSPKHPPREQFEDSPMSS